MATPTTQQQQPNTPRRPIRNNTMMLRNVSRIIVGALVVVVAAVFGVHALLDRGQSDAPKLQGTSLDGIVAPDFTLADQTGATMPSRDRKSTRLNSSHQR